MYHPTTRVLTVLELLQAHPRLSGADLAERLEVDRRTVRRYITMLQDLGIPVEAERGPHGGYQLRPGFKLPPLMLNGEEALAVTLGLLAARHLGLDAAGPAAESALAKIGRVLPAVVAAQVRALQAALGFTAPPRGSGPPAPVATILALTAAVEQRQQVQFRYRAWRGEVSGRSVDPYGLVHHRGRWYLAGRDHARGDLRTFRVDRIDEIRMNEATFERRLDFDAVAHVVRSLATVPYGQTLEVLLDLPFEEARLRVAPTVATVEETPTGVLLRSNSESLDAAARYLVSLGCPFVVLQPEGLREALRRLAADLVATADGTAE